MVYSYDEKQYESFSYGLTYPEHLQTIARLFKVDAPPYENARILELGCASGGNIIPIAFNFPRTNITGIDLSKKQIEEGITLIKDLHLKNIEIKHESILDFHSSEKYDYIICHGVFSWVPETVRSKILAICAENLNPTGIACISYNTMPCWNMVLCVRDMMQYHVKNVNTPEEKVQQARIFLNFLTKGLENENTPYAKFLRDEIKIVSSAQDYYIYHEYLEDVNQPMYFYEFVSQAKKFKLSYLGDSHLPSMFPGNLKETFSKKLAQLNDVVKVGQYMDFIRNQRFRTTLLCHETNSINRQLNVEDAEKFCISYAGKKQDKIAKDRILTNETITFEAPGCILTVQKPIAKACMSILHENAGKPISYKKLLKRSMQYVNEADTELARKLLNHDLNLVRLSLAGIVKFHIDEGIYDTVISSQPKTSLLIQKIAKLRDRVPNLRHETLMLLPVERILLQYLDGKRKISKINRILEDKVLNKELNLTDEQNKPVVEKKQIHERIQKLTLTTLENLAKKAYLLA